MRWRVSGVMRCRKSEAGEEKALPNHHDARGRIRQKGDDREAKRGRGRDKTPRLDVTRPCQE